MAAVRGRGLTLARNANGEKTAGTVVTFYAYTAIGLEHITRHVDRYGAAGYRFTTEARGVGHGISEAIH